MDVNVRSTLLFDHSDTNGTVFLNCVLHESGCVLISAFG
jgi:hypothetical protein